MASHDDQELEQRIRATLLQSIQVKQMLLEGPLDPIARVVTAIEQAFRAGHKLLLFGNGGSAADAQHIAAEFVNRFLRRRPPLAALALTTDSSVLTSIGNDESFHEIFARQIRALGIPGDVAWGITTSGESPNVLRGLQEARSMGLLTVGMTGGSGGAMGRIVDHWIHVNHAVVPRVQETHITIGHIICELVEGILFPDSSEAEV
jgi:D-sedoheptulose 7-phosphate isomerase